MPATPIYYYIRYEGAYTKIFKAYGLMPNEEDCIPKYFIDYDAAADVVEDYLTHLIEQAAVNLVKLKRRA